MQSVKSNDYSQWDVWWRQVGHYNEYPSIAWDLMDDDKAGYLLKYVGNKRGMVLEVGCGTARMSARLAQAGFITICLDSSPSALPLAKNNYLKHDIGFIGLVADGYRLPFPDDKFDGILSTGLLEHFQDPLPLLKEMIRVTRKEGFIYADILPQKKWRLLLLFDFIRPMLGRYIDDLEEMPFTGKDIKLLALKAALKCPVIFPAGTYWPRWPVLRSSRRLVGLENLMCRLTHPLFKTFDKSALAEIFGVYYFVLGRK